MNMSNIAKIRQEFEKVKEIFLSVKVIAGAKENKVSWKNLDEVKVKVNAVAEGGKANKEVVNVLAKELGIRKYQVKIVKGKLSNHKVIKISR